jgi:DNA-binding MarR family transcriptional regulator
MAGQGSPYDNAAEGPPDIESRARQDDHQDLRLWLRLLACCNLLESEVRGRLRVEFSTTLPRFDLMAQLDRAPAGMKMSELSRHMMVTNGNITGITDQLENDGLVERGKVATDRRSSIIRLTPKGQREFRKMAQSHEQWIQSLMAGLPPDTHQALFDGLAALKQLIQQRLMTR